MLPMGLKRAMAAICLLQVAAPFDNPTVLLMGESGGTASKRAVKVPVCGANEVFRSLCVAVAACVVAGQYNTQDAPHSNTIAASRLARSAGFAVSGRRSMIHADPVLFPTDSLLAARTSSVLHSAAALATASTWAWARKHRRCCSPWLRTPHCVCRRQRSRWRRREDGRS